MLMKRDRIVPSLLWGLAILLVGGIVHIVSILIIPRIAPNDAFARVAAKVEPGTVQILPRAISRQNTLPFRDPALASAVCRYDLAQGPLRVSAAVGDSAFVSVSFHSRFGLPFYGLNDRASNDGKLDILLLSAAQLDNAEAADSEDSTIRDRDVRVTSPTMEGFVVFDVLPRVGGYAAGEQALRSVSCKVERSL